MQTASNAQHVVRSLMGATMYRRDAHTVSTTITECVVCPLSFVFCLFLFCLRLSHLHSSYPHEFYFPPSPPPPLLLVVIYPCVNLLPVMLHLFEIGPPNIYIYSVRIIVCTM